MILLLFLVPSLYAKTPCRLSGEALVLLPRARVLAATFAEPTVVRALPNALFGDSEIVTSIEPLRPRRSELVVTTTYLEAAIPPGGTEVSVVEVTDRIWVTSTGVVSGMGECEARLGQAEAAITALFYPD